MMLTIQSVSKADDLLAEAADWPLELEVLCTMPLSMAARLADQGDEAPYQAVFRDGDRAVGAALGMPGDVSGAWPAEFFVAAETSNDDSADALADLLAADLDALFETQPGETRPGETLPGLFGPTRLVERACKALAARRGVEARPGMSNVFYRLHEPVAPKRLPSGSFRRARTGDHDLVARWLDAFVQDAEVPPLDAAKLARYLVGKGDVLLWLDGDGHRGVGAVSMAAVSGRTPRCARIGFVYTPPEARGRGYGAAITDATHRHALDGGAETCCLFADAQNALTNRLYRRLGYRRVEDVLDVTFAA